MNRVAVYGTLRKNQGLYGSPLEGEIYLGDSKLPEDFELFNLGSFPCVSRVSTPLDTTVVCEVYEIDDNVLAVLDSIEGHPDFFKREHVEVDGFGTCWVYVLYGHNGVLIDSGDWNER